MCNDSNNDTGYDMSSLMLGYAKSEKADAREKYHNKENGSFEQGIKLGRMHAMADLVEERGDIGPVTRLGDVVNIEEFHADGRLLVEVNLR